MAEGATVMLTYDWTDTPPENVTRFGVPLVDMAGLTRSLRPGRRDDGLMRPDPDGQPALPTQSEDETGIGWGDDPVEDNDERLRQERPPHWDQDGA